MTTTTRTQTIATLVARAERILGIEIGITGRRAHYYDESADEAYWVSRADLAYAADCAHEADAYSTWCAGTGRLMAPRSRRTLYDR